MVECGVWRGGSAMAVLRTLLELGVRDRDVWLYDTFTAMPAPTERDVDLHGVTALSMHAEYAVDTSVADPAYDRVHARPAVDRGEDGSAGAAVHVLLLHGHHLAH